MVIPREELNRMLPEELAYIAGFIDGDGCINCQIIPRKDYRYKFQIRISLSITQKTSRHWILLWFAKKIKSGTIRKRSDGISELTLVGKNQVIAVLKALLPFFKLKRRQAILVLEIGTQLSKDQDPQSFLKLCEQVDKIAQLNDSKKRKFTAQVVRETLLKDSLLSSP